MYYHCTISLYMLNTIWDNHCLLCMCPTLFIPYSTTLYQRKKCDCLPLLQHRSYGIPFFFSFNSNCRHICRKKLRVFLYYNIVFFFIAPTFVGIVIVNLIVNLILIRLKWFMPYLQLTHHIIAKEKKSEQCVK